MKLVLNEQVVEVDEFETADPALRGEMTITITLTDADGGTDILAVHEELPRGLSTADNETGWRMALAKLAALVEADEGVGCKCPGILIQSSKYTRFRQIKELKPWMPMRCLRV